MYIDGVSPAVHHDVLRALADPTRQQILRQCHHGRRHASSRSINVSHDASFSRYDYLCRFPVLRAENPSKIVDVPTSRTTSPPTLEFDPEWLAITRAFNAHMPIGLRQGQYPPEDAARAAVREAEVWVRANVFDVQVDGGRGEPTNDSVIEVPASADISRNPYSRRGRRGTSILHAYIHPLTCSTANRANWRRRMLVLRYTFSAHCVSGTRMMWNSRASPPIAHCMR